MEKSTYILFTLFSLALGAVRAEGIDAVEESSARLKQEIAALRKHSDIEPLSDRADRISTLEQQMKQVYTDTVRDTFGAKAASARPQLDSYHLYVSGDFLFWKAFEGGNDYAYATNASGSSSGRSKDVDFNWSYGFRAEFGYRTGHDDWNLAGHYTWFFDKADSDMTADSGEEVVPLFYQPSSSTFSSAAGNLRLHFNDADLALQKSYFLSPKFSLTSLAALRTTWIDQKTSLSATGSSDSLSLSGKNSFWGIGPKIGIAPKWFVNSNWNFFGAFAGSLLYAEFDVKIKALVDGTVAADFKPDLHQIVPTVQGALGFGWETNFLCNRYHIAFNVSYEAQYWWRQNQWFSYLPDSQPTVILKRLGEDLGFQGLTINALFDF